ncbi:response regulator transcription factor [soil metagenome]
MAPLRSREHGCNLLDTLEFATPIDPDVVIVGEDPLARSGLASLLASQGLSVAQARTPQEAAEAKADVAVWDFGADRMGVTTLVPELEAQGVPVIALLPDSTHAATVHGAGAKGILLRATSGGALLAAVRAVHVGLSVFDAEPLSRIAPVREALGPAEDLTVREREVLGELSLGLANKEIAQKMKISDHTVKFHVNAILQKLGVTSRTEAVVQAARRGWVIL